MDEKKSAISQEQIESFHRNGYLILEGFFTPTEIAAFKAHVQDMWACRPAFHDLTIDCYLDGPYSIFNRQLFGEIEDAVRNHPYKLNDSHLLDPLIQDFAINKRLVSILNVLMESKVSACNTLLFERGSQQPAHFDTFYMPSKTPNKMCASWIAIDPVTADNGPLFYYPGSHLVEPYHFSGGTLRANNEEMPKAMEYILGAMALHGIAPTTFYPNPGDVFLWHAQLLHGGSEIKDMQQTRTSLVTHYWTTIDFPNASDHVDLGDDRLYIKKSHQLAASKATRQEIAEHLASLSTPSEHRTDVPSGFDPALYLLRNSDVLVARVDPFSHYVLHGRSEGRTW